LRARVKKKYELLEGNAKGLIERNVTVGLPAAYAIGKKKGNLVENRKDDGDTSRGVWQAFGR